MKKRVFSIFLALVMVLCLVPTVAMAEGNSGTAAAKFTLTDASVAINGVKLLNENDGTEMTSGKTYDGKAVAYDASGAGYTPAVSNVTLTYQWQEKGEGNTYSDLSNAPINAGSYRLLVTAVRVEKELGRLELPFEISPVALTTGNIESAPADVEYDGKEQKWVPGLVDKDGNALCEGRDYVVTYDRDEFVSAGSISVTITGLGNYTGELTQSYEITAKPLTVISVAVENKLYDGTNTASFSGTPALNGVVAGNDVTLVNGTPSFADINIGNNIAVNFTEFKLDGDDAGNYTLTKPDGITASIGIYTATGEEYTATTGDWTNEDFKITAADGWKVSTTNTADGEWRDSLTCSEETDNGSLTFYVRETDTGVISEAITKTYKIDKTAPTGEIRIDEQNAWQKFLNTISFNLFYKDEQAVTITASDSASGVDSIGYLLTDEDLGIEALAEKTFTDYSNSVGIKPDDKLIAYAKITDKAGNVTYLRSDGIVLDATAPVISGATNGSTHCAAVTLTITDDYLGTVQLNSETVSLTDGKLTIAPKAGEQTVTATDKSGNSTTLTITVNDGHSGGTATCKEQAVCQICLQPYGSTNPKNHTGSLGEWQTNETLHWKIYSCCNAQSEVGRHTDSDNDHICDICGYDKLGVHADADKDHKCDYGCSTLIGECVDTNLDHHCDYGCGKYFGEHADNDDDHNCDYCGQKISEHSGGTATCNEKAICDVCREAYGEENPNNHANLKQFPENAATAAEEGNKEYWYCDGCKKYFSDENAENEIGLADTVIEKLAPTIIKGDGQTITVGEKKALEFTSDAAFADFIRVEVDGKTIDESNYTVESGSIVVTLNADYVATLSAGEHTFGIVSQSGTATTKFTVNEKVAETTTPTTTDNTTSPKTGDNSNIFLWLALLFVSGGAVTVTAFSRKKKRAE